MSMFCDPKNKYKKFPELSGVKARKIRYLVPVAMEICREMQSDDYPYSKHRWLCLKNLENMYACMEADPGVLHLSTPQINEFRESTNLMLQHYTACSKICLERGLLQWNTVHKHHLCAHMPD